jgi:hypothetical protein
MASVLKQQPLQPTLLASPQLIFSIEQRQLLERILDLTSSDSRFSQKALEAINLIMLGTNATSPVINSLNPSSAIIGSPNFRLRVLGTGFNFTSTIVFNGFNEPTTFVSSTEVNTGVNMAVWLAPSNPLPVHVLNNGNILSNAMLFKFNAA